jgi:hypothetical protein
MPGGAGQLSSGGGGQGRSAGAVTAEPSWAAQRPQVAVPGRGRAAQRVVAGREDVRTPARPVVALSASSGPAAPMSVQPVERTSSIHASGVQASGVQCIRVSGRTGLWCLRRCRRAVHAALDPGVARCGGLPRLGAADRRAVGRGRRGCLPVSGLTARGWRGVGRGWLARGSTVARAAARPASRLRRRPGRWATGGAGQGQGANRVTGEHGMEQVLTGPRRVSWAVVGVVPGHGPGLGGGDHAAWSLARGGPVASSSGDPLGSVGDSLRPQRGRGA